MKLLSGTQSRVEQYHFHICATTDLSAADTAATAREYIFIIPETQMPASQAIQPVQQSLMVSRGQQQPRGPQTSYLVIDEQKPGTSRQLYVTISPTKAFNPPSVASVTCEESSHNISRASAAASSAPAPQQSSEPKQQQE